MKNNQIVVGLIIIAVAVGGFFGGMKYQQSKQPVFPGANRSQFGQNTNRAGGTGNRAGGQIVGEILSADDKSITVKIADGSSKIIFLSTNTSIIKSSQAGTTDLVVGSRVGIFGQTNMDGSVTAQNIQLNPIDRNATPSAASKK